MHFSRRTSVIGKVFQLTSHYTGFGGNVRWIFFMLVIILVAGFVLSSCQNFYQNPSPSPTGTGIDRKVLAVITATATATAIPTPTITPPPPTLIPQEPPPTRLPTSCQDGLELVLELSLAPGPGASLPVLPPGSEIEKGWRLRNSGTCTWDSAYLFAPEESNVVWAVNSQLVPLTGQVQAGEMYDFWVKLTAPRVPGSYQAGWSLHNSQGEAVGLPLTVGFEIAALPTETAQPKVSLAASPLEILRGEDAIISWSTTEAKAAYFYPFGQTWWQHPVEVNGSILVEPDQTTTYELRAVMGDDSIEFRRITIVIKPFDAPKIVTFRLEPASVIDQGQCVDLVWRINGRVNTVKVFRDGNFFVESEKEVGSTWDCPANTGFYTYTLQVSGPGGTTESNRQLEVR
ncbi:MAG: hypothetical protein A2W35_12345 [Chloroflexi bacterium RBG_16_57_11]|nr:MAG: hypothetical protein A2W35_12345 [Chloroflexi bacterium RBG_16_57_11]